MTETIERSTTPSSAAKQLPSVDKDADRAALAAAMPLDRDGLLGVAMSAVTELHAAVLASDSTATDLAINRYNAAVWKLNGGTLFGSLGDPDAAGYVIERHCAALPGAVPMWGQGGQFLIQVQGMRIRVEFGGGTGLLGNHYEFHAVDLDKPFISETGYRSHFDRLRGGMTVDAVAAEIVAAYLAKERAVAIKDESRGRLADTALPDWLPLNCVPTDEVSAESAMNKIMHELPLERWYMAHDASNSLLQLSGQKVVNGKAQTPEVKAIRLNGRLYASTCAMFHGDHCEFEAWELVKEAEFQGETVTRYHDEAAIKAGTRIRGDHHGLIVTHAGARYVLDRRITVRSNPAISDVGKADRSMTSETKKKKRGNDYGRTLLGEPITAVIEATVQELLRDRAARKLLGAQLAANMDPTADREISSNVHRDELERECGYLDAAIQMANDFLAQFTEGPEDVATENKPAAHSFKRGDAVMYYGSSGPEKLTWGAKMQSYRVLAYDPGNLDVGLCIKEDEVGRTIFPAPNEHGVYKPAAHNAPAIEYRKNRWYVRVEYLQVGPQQWVSRWDYMYGSGGGSTPAHACCVQANWEDAVRYALTHVISDLASTAASASVLAIRKFAKDAMLALLAQIPAALQTTIINDIKQKRENETHG